jgi:hypothetical protein
MILSVQKSEIENSNGFSNERETLTWIAVVILVLHMYLCNNEVPFVPCRETEAKE